MPKSAVHPTTALAGSVFKIPHNGGHDYAGWLVDRLVNRLIRRGEFLESDRDDLSQELILKLLESWPQFDPQKAQATTYVATVVRNAVSNLIRRERLETEHICVMPNAPDTEVESCEPVVDRQLDVATVLERLPPELQKLAGRLMTESVKEVARSDGVPLSDIKHQAQQLHDAFAAADVTLEL